MESDPDIVAVEMDANLDQARRTAVMAHSVVVHLRQCGLPATLDAELARLGTDLGDIWGAQKEFTDSLHAMLKSAHDWETIGDSLVDLRAAIDHIAWHIDGVREPLTIIAKHAYSRSAPNAPADE